MLPKVANHLIQHTSRAVAAVQNSAFRNVLQLQSSPNTVTNWNGSPSSSGWGGSGTGGAGGAKYHSSRFNGNYSALGRGVSLADPSVSSGNKGELADDSDDFQLATIESNPVSIRSRQRTRSGSLTFTIQDTASNGSVLKAIRQHVRSLHTLEKQQRRTALKSSKKGLLDAPEEIAEPRATRTIIEQLESKRVMEDWLLTNDAISHIYSPNVVLTPRLFDAAFKALLFSRPKHESISPVLKLYNHMTASSIAPTRSIYWSLIHSLLNQDHECYQSIETRKKALSLLDGDAEEVERLQNEISAIENNRSFNLALSLFQVTCEDPNLALPMGAYTRFLSVSLENHRPDVARFTSLACAKRRLVPATAGWRDYILLQSEIGDLDGAISTFAEFRKQVDRGKCMETGSRSLNLSIEPYTSYSSVWGEMIHAYIRHGRPDEGLSLLEEMLDSDTDFIPHPNGTTFARIIAAFGDVGDPKSALAWFDRLLQQPEPCTDPDYPCQDPTQPAPAAWIAISQILNTHGMYDDLDRLLALANEQSLLALDSFAVCSIFFNRISYLQSNPEILAAEGVAKLDFLVSVLFPDASTLSDISDTNLPALLCHKLVEQYRSYGRPDRALEVATDFFIMPLFSYINGGPVRNFTSRFQRMVDDTVNLLGTNTAPSWTLLHAARLARLSSLANQAPSDLAATHPLSVYTWAPPAEKDALDVGDWEMLFQAYVGAPEETHMTLKPLDVFQDDIARGVHINELHEVTIRSILDFLQATYREPQRLAIAAQLGIADLVRNSEAESQSASDGSRTPVSSVTTPSSPATGYTTPPPHGICIDEEISNKLSRMLGAPGKGTLEPYKLFEAGIQMGKYPNPMIIGRLINVVGRFGHLDKVQVLYDAAQKVLETLSDNKSAQSLGWFQVEDQMIIALAHAGDVDAAHVHRQRILSQNGTPSPDAYGILIQNIKDTTDDNTNALSLFHEAINRGVAPNVYLYNIIISKLARARKADSALDLFHAMKARGIIPTSVTYGALIAACGRVGDIASAENLFTEMASQRNFRPRIPPYNMMMQLYTQTKPDRERALYYYHEMLRTHIAPTAHTYKLLLDAYGTVEPADVGAMEKVFEQLLADHDLTVNGAHWASLIHAYGCVQKDLDKAIAIFESIKDHPSTKRSGAALPDAVAFEALINVFNTVRRTDLIPQYVAKLDQYGIHMTAYVANLLIRGYAMHGDIEQARAVFDSLEDPPEGVAAPNNHAPHNSEQAVSVPANAPVFREPSTWEAMVRAELGNGNRDKALDLLERVKARRFPAAVYHRISGIMLDDSVPAYQQHTDDIHA
ncbi:hypothetical protein BDY19DRAFT_1096614 [Irpex rosettiformis]|uniref:Uncharacterized protein n=1 Tax=Irpex rosettiformis TaxID=378272 RepID=A0ACB8TQ78_9APHY|nr:hypothetical protein BDY19DRAFT_1096614 [Irpex rosettiformis]